MQNLIARYFLIFITVAFVGFVLWYFRALISYILISAVLSLIGRPVVDILEKVRYKKIRIPRWMSALFTLLLLWGVFIMFFRIFIPLLASQASELANISPESFIASLDEPIENIEAILYRLELDAFRDVGIKEIIAQRLNAVFDVDMFRGIISGITTMLGNIFIAVFSVSFITFFFLKDERLFVDGVLIFIPPKYEEQVRHVLSSIKKLLMRYFIGIILQITGVITLITIGMSIVGLGFENSLVIGLFTGVFNVIPYLGPLIGAIIGLFLGVVTNLDLTFYDQMLPMLIYMVIVFIAVQQVDNLVFQPLIYGTSVYAHPLEIFIVLMMGGYIAGILGMLLAIPSYTVIRVIAKEFFNQFKVVKKLTENI